MSQNLAVGAGELTAATVRIAGLALLSAVVSLVVSFAYRWYGRDRLPDGVGVLVGVAAVAVVLNTQSALQSAIVGESALLDPASAVFTLSAFAVGGVSADGGRRVGDWLGRRTAPVAALRDLGEMGQIVRTGGRAVTVELPAEVDDIDGYDPVDAATREALAGSTLVFPRGLTVAELRDRLVERLREDHGVGHVDVELTPGGVVEYLAVGSRAAGIGTTLPPGTVAVAVRADPPHSASPGDVVQVWTGGADPRRVATGEFRGAAGDVATLAVDDRDADALDDATRYRLVTLPGDADVEREFASLLRAADETMAAVTVSPGSSLAGLPVGAVDVTVVAVHRDGVDAIPARSRTLAAGDVLYVVGRPETLRRIEAAADPGGESPGPDRTLSRG